MTGFTSISSLKAQRQLSSATDALARSSGRLSSGRRINSASDDAAGLAISSSLKRDSKLFGVAMRNVNDGISTLNIMQGTLQNQNAIITRLQELAEQSANGVYSTTQRYGLNAEYQELLREFGRIGDTTTFNNIALLLAGRGNNATSLGVQAGISGSTNSGINIQLTDSGSLSGTILLNAVQTYADPPANQPLTIDQLASYGVAVMRFKYTDGLGKQRDGLLQLQPDVGTGVLSILAWVRGDNSDGTITTKSDEWVPNGSGTGINFDTTTGRFTSSTTSQISLNGIAGGGIGSATIDLSGVSFTIGSVAGNYNSIGFSGIETQTEAKSALTLLSQRLADSSQALGRIGAAQSRLTTASALLAVSRENFLAANSQIEDVDVANETAQYVASQIQQQVAVSVLAQANSQPQFLLNILKAT